MYTYTAFFIKREFACHYFHKSGILFRFLNYYQNQKATSSLKMQYNYITSGFSKDKLLSHLQKFCTHHIQVSGDTVMITDNEHYLSLHIYEKHVEFRCETLHAAETLLFPAMRTFNPLLFIIENNFQNYGWISPVLLSREDKKEQVLYSQV